MNVTNITNDYDNITTSNYSDHDNMTLCNCTNNENDIDIIILALLFNTPCGFFVCLISLMVYTLVKALKNKR